MESEYHGEVATPLQVKTPPELEVYVSDSGLGSCTLLAGRRKKQKNGIKIEQERRGFLSCTSYELMYVFYSTSLLQMASAFTCTKGKGDRAYSTT